MKRVTLFVSLFFVACSSKSPQPVTPILSFEATETTQPQVPHPSCPSGMIEVEGEYCPNAKEECLEWVDAKGHTSKEAIPDDRDSGRCGTFKYPTVCVGNKVHKHFCIDKYEYPNVEGQRPQSWMTWYDVKNSCEAQGKRLCTRSEWAFACEGPEMHPLPYGDGYHRDHTSCNIDNPVPENPERPIDKRTGRHGKVHVMEVRSHDSSDARVLDRMLAPSGSMQACVSPFGVHDMVGNIDEFVVNESHHPYVSGLMSGHVFGVRNACRPMTEGHGPEFSWYETGGRCCRFPTN